MRLAWKKCSLFPDRKFLYGYAGDGTLVAFVDARKPDGLWGIIAQMEIRSPRRSEYKEKNESMASAKAWCELRWEKKLRAWLKEFTP